MQCIQCTLTYRFISFSSSIPVICKTRLSLVLRWTSGIRGTCIVYTPYIFKKYIHTRAHGFENINKNSELYSDQLSCAIVAVAEILLCISIIHIYIYIVMQPPKITQCHKPTTALYAVVHCTRHLGSICVYCVIM